MDGENDDELEQLPDWRWLHDPNVERDPAELGIE
jgi:hypothetical protein